MRLIAGVDEAGRGPLAGPVIAAAVVLVEPLDGLADSKALSARQREYLFGEIRNHAQAWSVGRADVEEIDTLNILQASLLAMQRAVASLGIDVDEVLVDGNRLPVLECAARAVVNGDATVPVISAASIVAKVTRDREMEALDRQFPGYGLAIHKGYPTRKHLEALERLGPSSIHRRSFGPVQRLLGA